MLRPSQSDDEPEPRTPQWHSGGGRPPSPFPGAPDEDEPWANPDATTLYGPRWSYWNPRPYETFEAWLESSLDHAMSKYLQALEDWLRKNVIDQTTGWFPHTPKGLLPPSAAAGLADRMADKPLSEQRPWEMAPHFRRPSHCDTVNNYCDGMCAPETDPHEWLRCHRGCHMMHGCDPGHMDLS
jgi:hypothetical protein